MAVNRGLWEFTGTLTLVFSAKNFMMHRTGTLALVFSAKNFIMHRTGTLAFSVQC